MTGEFDIDNLVDLIVPVIPIIVLLLGGQKLINYYSITKKRQESEIELISGIRTHQYQTLNELYNLFAKFMELYRKLNSPLATFKTEEERDKIIREITIAEAAVDAMILKIGCEFAKESDDEDELEYLLGNLRQSVQIWRQRFVKSKPLPFTFSDQKDYMRFKSAFASITAFVSNRLHQNIEPHKTKMKRVEKILVGAFHNKHEKWIKDSVRSRPGR